MMRLETTLSDEAEIQQVEWLRALLDEGNSGLLRDALTLFAWAVEEVRSGRRIASFDPASDSVREFTMPELRKARHRGVRTFHPEGLARSAELLESPPEPTEALRTLMDEPEEAAAGS
jgi:hypothetical protein